MALRLVLVGVVASLGLTLPSREALDACTRSGQAWMNRRLAEWESRRPVDESAYVYVADAVEPARPAVTSDAALALKTQFDEEQVVVESSWNAFDRQVSVNAAQAAAAREWETQLLVESSWNAFDRQVSLDAAKAAAAREWETQVLVESSWNAFDRQVSLDAAQAAAAREWETQLLVESSWNAFDRQVSLDAAKAASERTALMRKIKVAVTSATAVLAKAHAKLIEVGNEIEAEQKRVAAENRTREFDLAIDEMFARFVPEAAPAPVIGKPEDVNGSFDRAVDEMIAAFSEDVERAEAAKRLAVRERAEWLTAIELDEAFEAVEVQAATRALAVATNSPSSPQPGALAIANAKSGAVSEPSRLANAVRLTREAVNAWASLLHGPAVVTISR